MAGQDVRRRKPKEEPEPGMFERWLRNMPVDRLETVMRWFAPGTGGRRDNPYRSQFLRPDEDVLRELPPEMRPDPSIWPPGQSPSELYPGIKWREAAQYGPLGTGYTHLRARPAALTYKEEGAYPLSEWQGRRPTHSAPLQHLLGEYYRGVHTDPETGEHFGEEADIYDIPTGPLIEKYYSLSQLLPTGKRSALDALNARGEPFAVYNRFPLEPTVGPVRSEAERTYRRRRPR